MEGPVTSQMLSLWESEQEARGCAAFVSGSWMSGWTTGPMGKVFTVNKMYTLYVKNKIKGIGTYNEYIIKYNYHNF